MSSVLREMNPSVEPEMKALDGHACYVVHTNREGGIAFTLWIDPNRGFRPLRMEVRQLGHLLVKYDNIELTQLSNNIWFPTSATCYGYLPNNDKQGALYKIERCKVGKLEVNSGIPDAVFAPEFPSGTMVYDEVESIRYRVGEVSRELREDSSESAKPERGGPATAITPVTPASASPLDLKIKAVSLPGVSLREAIEVLKTQVGKDKNFVVDPRVDCGPISVDLKDMTLGQALTAMLKGSNLTFVFVPSDNIIYISTKAGCVVYEHYLEPAVPEGQPELKKVFAQTIRAVSLPGVTLPEGVALSYSFALFTPRKRRIR